MTDPTPEQQTEQLALAVATVDAGRLLQWLSPTDSLAIACYALGEIAAYRPPEGVALDERAEILIGVAKFTADGLVGTPYARPAEGTNPLARTLPDGEMSDSEASDDGAWAENFIDMNLSIGLLPLGSTMLTAELMLHYVARGDELDVNDRMGDNKLGLAPLASPPETRAAAQAVLANHLMAMQAAAPYFAATSGAVETPTA